MSYLTSYHPFPLSFSGTYFFSFIVNNRSIHASVEHIYNLLVLVADSNAEINLWPLLSFHAILPLPIYQLAKVCLSLAPFFGLLLSGLRPLPRFMSRVLTRSPFLSIRRSFIVSSWIRCSTSLSDSWPVYILYLRIRWTWTHTLSQGRLPGLPLYASHPYSIILSFDTYSLLIFVRALSVAAVWVVSTPLHVPSICLSPLPSPSVSLPRVSSTRIETKKLQSLEGFSRRHFCFFYPHVAFLGSFLFLLFCRWLVPHLTESIHPHHTPPDARLLHHVLQSLHPPLPWAFPLPASDRPCAGGLARRSGFKPSR